MSEYRQDPDLTPDEDTIALAVYRQSKGTDDSASLEQQRETVPEMLHDEREVDGIEALDLGVHTGFSRHTRDDDEPHVESNDDYMAALRAVEAGRYDVVAAYEERRLARDEFINRWDYAAETGGADLLFSIATPDDELTAGVTRVVERATKKKEIREAKEAIRRRQNNGYYQGDVPFGVQFDDQQRYLVRDPDEFEVVEDILEARDRGMSYEAIADDVPVAKSTVYRVVQRRDWYEAVANGARIGNDGPIAVDGEKN